MSRASLIGRRASRRARRGDRTTGDQPRVGRGTARTRSLPNRRSGRTSRSRSRSSGSRWVMPSAPRFFQWSMMPRVERRGPRHAAFEQAELEVREAARDAAEEERLADRFAAVGEAARSGCTGGGRSTGGWPSRWGRNGRWARPSAPGTWPRPGRSRSRCRCRTCPARTRRCRTALRTARGRRAAPPAPGAARRRRAARP